MTSPAPCGARIQDRGVGLWVSGLVRSCCDLVLADESTQDRSAANLVIGEVDHWWWLGFRAKVWRPSLMRAGLLGKIVEVGPRKLMAHWHDGEGRAYSTTGHISAPQPLLRDARTGYAHPGCYARATCDCSSKLGKPGALDISRLAPQHLCRRMPTCQRAPLASRSGEVVADEGSRCQRYVHTAQQRALGSRYDGQ
jgi:hypothetical protein